MPAPERAPAPRVLLAVNSGERGGAQLLALALARELARTRPVSISVPPGPLRSEFARHGVLVPAACALPIWTSRPRPWLRRVVRTARDTIRLRRAIAQQGSGAVVVSSSAMLAPVLAGRLAGVSVLVHVREWPSSPARRFLLRLHARLADTMIPVSAGVAAACPRGRRARIALVRDGIPIPPAPPSRRLGVPLRLLVLGSLDPHKNPEAAVDVVAHLARRGVPARLRVVGPDRGGHSAVVLKRADELGVARSVAVHPPVESAAAVLADADVLLVCSRGTHDVTPLVIMEALAHGVPVVATRVGSVPELLQDGANGRLVAPGDTEAMAEAALAIQRDRARSLRIAQRGRRWIESHHDRRDGLAQLRELLDASY